MVGAQLGAEAWTLDVLTRERYKHCDGYRLRITHSHRINSSVNGTRTTSTVVVVASSTVTASC